MAFLIMVFFHEKLDAYSTKVLIITSYLYYVISFFKRIYIQNPIFCEIALAVLG